MAVNYNILDYTIKALVELLMNKYGCSFDSAMAMVLSSDLYKRLQQDAHLLEEGDIFLFEQLDKEVNVNRD